MKKFEVTFKENKKYNPATRKTYVETTDSENARLMVIEEFGSFGRDKSNGIFSTFKPSNKIEILDVKEVKEFSFN